MQDMQESVKVISSSKTGVLDAARHAEEARDAWKKLLADMPGAGAATHDHLLALPYLGCSLP